MLTRNESAAMRSASAALRRDVDTLNVRMKEDIANLKHEYVPIDCASGRYINPSYRIQMEVENRKNESKDDMKQIDIQIEVNSFCISSEQRTENSVYHLDRP